MGVSESYLDDFSCAAQVNCEMALHLKEIFQSIQRLLYILNIELFTPTPNMLTLELPSQKFWVVAILWLESC